MSTVRSDTIHIEPSSRCTLGCLECPRTIHKGDYSIDDCDIDLMARSCIGFKTVLLCGNHGDPIYHPRLCDLISKIRQDTPDVSFIMDTNGSFRSKMWWEELSAVLNESDTVVFSIDGMPWNNHLYRVNSKWETVETGIQTLRRNNPNVHMNWKWILFKYNQDQLTAGINLATEFGFDSFTVVHSARYGMHEWLIPNKSIKDIELEINEWTKSHPDAS